MPVTRTQAPSLFLPPRTSFSFLKILSATRTSHRLSPNLLYLALSRAHPHQAWPHGPSTIRTRRSPWAGHSPYPCSTYRPSTKPLLLYSSLANTPTAFLPDSLIGPMANLRSIQLRFPLNRLRSESIRRATSLNIVLKPPYRRGSSDPTYRYLVDLLGVDVDLERSRGPHNRELCPI